MNVNDESIAELFEQYKEEVRESIGFLDSELVAAEREPSNSEVIFSIFRHLHSLKGASKMFNVENIGHIAHKLEDLMQMIDQDNSILGRFPQIIDLLFEGNDIFRKIIDILEDDVTYLHLTPEHAQFIERINAQIDMLNRKENVLLESAQLLLDELDALLPSLDDVDTTRLSHVMKSLADNVRIWTLGIGNEGLRYVYGGKDFTSFMLAYQHGLEIFQAGTHTPQNLEEFFQNIDQFTHALFEVAGEDIMGVLQELNDGMEMFLERALEIDPVVIEFFSVLLVDLKEFIKAEAGAPESSGDNSVPEDTDGVAPQIVLAKEAQAPHQQVKTIRVDEKKIDHFLDSVGKLITQSEILNHLQHAFKNAGISSKLVRDFSAVNRAISNDIIDLQKSIMEVRQVEMDNILKKFPRLVRDISHNMGKDVELEISGERTPIDKSLLEDVEKALIHIVRNAIDHGLESPEVREAEGKNRRGLIKIGVEQGEASISIEVSDDGRGIDFSAVRRKALERGMITPDQFRNMNDEESEDLLFRSGLSTKDEATDISGRGVGLDVVRSNVKKWNGEVSLTNRFGQGLSLNLFIPITNTLLTKEAILLTLSGLTFCLPLEHVVEIVTVPEQRIHRHKDSTFFEHRDQVINVLNLKVLLGMSQDHCGGEASRTFILLRAKHECRKAICADEIIGQQKIVIKDFELEDFRRLAYCQGMTLLGDGRVVLILDAEKIVG